MPSDARPQLRPIGCVEERLAVNDHSNRSVLGLGDLDTLAGASQPQTPQALDVWKRVLLEATSRGVSAD
jgi:hypothetical protein